MLVIFHILSRNILPLFILIGIGFVLDRKFTLNIVTLSKMNFYLFVPAFVFVSLYQTEIAVDAFMAALVVFLIILSNLLVSQLLARVRRYSIGMKSAFQNSVMFYNTGNIGIPLVTLVFSTGAYLIDGQTPYLAIALATQVVVMVVQNVTTNTLGLFQAGRANLHWKQAILSIARMPTIYMLILALSLKAIPYDMTRLPFWISLDYARLGLIPVGLFTLGVQLSRSHFNWRSFDVFLAVITRLLIGPALALIFIWLLRIDGIVAQALFISTAVPTSVNSALIAVEYENYPDFATQVVVFSTIASMLTMTGVIYLSGLLFSF